MMATRTVDFLNPDHDQHELDGTERRAEVERPALRIVRPGEASDEWSDLSVDDLSPVFDTDDEWTELELDDLTSLDDDDEEHFSLDAPPDILLDAIAKDMELEERRARLPRIGRKRRSIIH